MAAGRTRKMTHANGEVKEEFAPDIGWERWRGAVDENLKNINRGQEQLHTAITNQTVTITAAVREAHEPVMATQKDHEKRIRELETHHVTTRAKVAIFAGLAGLLGGGLSSAAWGLVFKKMFP